MIINYTFAKNEVWQASVLPKPSVNSVPQSQVQPINTQYMVIFQKSTTSVTRARVPQVQPINTKVIRGVGECASGLKK